MGKPTCLPPCAPPPLSGVHPVIGCSTRPIRPARASSPIPAVLEPQVPRDLPSGRALWRLTARHVTVAEVVAAVLKSDRWSLTSSCLRRGLRSSSVGGHPRHLSSRPVDLTPLPRHVHPSVGGVGDGARALRRAPGPAGGPRSQHCIALPNRAGDGPRHRVPHHGDLPAPEEHAGGKEGGPLSGACLEKARCFCEGRSSLFNCYLGSLGVDAAALGNPRVWGRPHLHSLVFPDKVSVPKCEGDVFQTGSLKRMKPHFLDSTRFCRL